MENVSEGSKNKYLECTIMEIFECLKTCWSIPFADQAIILQEKLAELKKVPLKIHKKSFGMLKKMSSKMQTKWRECNRIKLDFLRKNQDWLMSSIKIQNAYVTVKDGDSTANFGKRGRPSAEFNDASDRTKRRMTEELLSKHSATKLVYATEMTLRASGSFTAANVLKDIVENGPTRALEYDTAVKKVSQQKIGEISADEALNLIISGKMSKATYMLMRDLVNKHCNVSIFPSYHKVICSKSRCYPEKESIHITETSAEVKLQALNDHTALRQLKNVHEDIVHFLPANINTLILQLKWGCDGTTGEEYKQKFSDVNSSDAHVFFTSVVPLQLTAKDEVTGNNYIVWKNPTPSSSRFCRPIRLQFVKETIESSCNERDYIQSQIASLKPLTTIVDDRNITVNYEMAFTMIDCKVRNAITETKSAQRCYICGATSKAFNDIDKIVQRDINEDNLQFGIASLHSWIRFMEWFLHLAYKMDDQKWQARSTEQKTKASERKIQIQKQFKAETGLIIDVPKQGMGSSNDGNTARRFFEDVSRTARILQIDEQLIDMCKNILQALSSGFKIDAEKFKAYCLEVAKLYVQLYSWYPMPTSVHLVLIHGHLIINSAMLPIGLLSEDAQEARNKDIKRFREYFSRKNSRLNNMSDVFHRLLASSDPLITSKRKLHMKKKEELPLGALHLLVPAEKETEASSLLTCVERDEVSNENSTNDYEFT